MHLISLKEVSKKFDNKKVLEKVTLDFDLGEFVVVLGKSGVGKSTLLNILDYSLKIDSGKLLFQDKILKKREIEGIKNKYIRKVYQNHNLIPYYTVYENLLLSKIISNNEIEEIDKFITYFGFEELKDKYPDQISGGEKQRIAIIRALLDNPLVILADEPTGSLDEKNSKKVLDLLKKNKQGKLIILVTHNNEIAEKYADRVIELKENGEMLDSGVKTKGTNFELTIESKEESNFRNLFLLNLKTFKRRISKMISLFVTLLLITTALSTFVGAKQGVHNYIKEMTENRIDKNVYQIYFESNEGIIENEDIFINTSFEYEKSISLHYLINNYLFKDFKINGSRIEEYYEISLIYDEELKNNFYVNQIMIDKVSSFNAFVFENEFIYEEFLLKEIIQENKIYNNPRIYLSYQYIKKKMEETKMLEHYLTILPELKSINDYYILNNKDAYDYLKNRKDCVSLYKSALMKEKGFYVFNNSRVMIKETFKELFDNLMLIIELLGSIMFIFLFLLTYLLMKYIYSFRRQELGLIIDQGGNINDLTKLIFADVGVVSVCSFVSSFFVLFLSFNIINESIGYKLLTISLTNTAIVYGVVFLIIIFVVSVFVFQNVKEDLSMCLKEEV